MTTHSMRPAVALAWILGLTLILTRPEIANTVLAVANWTLTSPAGAWALGVAFVASLTVVVRGTLGWGR